MSFLSTPSRTETTARRCLLWFEIVMASAATILMIAAIGLQVSARFLFEMALSWTDEVAVFSFVWVAMIGAAIVIETRSAHLIDYFVKKFPLTTQRVLQLAVFVLLIATLAVLIRYGIDITKVVDNQRSSILGLRMSFVYGAMPFSAMLMAVSMLLAWREYFIVDGPAEEGAA